jgi:hypothetical protein
MPVEGRSSARPRTLLALLVAAACSIPNETAPSPGESQTATRATAPEPSGLVTLPIGGGSLRIWPYIGENFTGQGQDPINLIFTGLAEPLQLREALLRLDGDRSTFGLPNVAPFNCTWSDAIGGIQAGFGDDAGWAPSAVQLQCGDYGPIRFHLRLFDLGNLTIGNAHFEILIPGTADHQVITWEVAEQLVTVDFVRSGLLAGAPTTTATVNDAPFRTIPAVVYAGIPEPLKATIGGPPGAPNADVPIGTDGRATVLTLGEAAPLVPGSAEQDFVLTYDQVVPKPFCRLNPGDLVLVQGPVHLMQRVELTPAGTLLKTFNASGRLSVTPIDGAQQPPIPAGPAYAADVSEQQTALASVDASAASSLVQQQELPPGGAGRGRLMVRFGVDRSGQTEYQRTEACYP